MKDEDRKAWRTFYKTLATESGAVSKAQEDFYKMVLRGDVATRKAWMATYIKDFTVIDGAVLRVLNSGDVISKEDIAFIVASNIAPKVPNLLDKFIAWFKGLF